MSDAQTTPTNTDPKPELAKSESWVTIVAVLGAIAPLVGSNASKIITVISLVISAGAYAFFHTSLPSEKPGWKTPAFWTAVATIVGSVALALTQADLPFLPVGVTKVASVIVAAVTAAGYTIYRTSLKRSGGATPPSSTGTPPTPPSEKPTPPDMPKAA